ncbi:MAG: hypothetical protein HC788_15965 [Sphingopyxis sp.]|nr:hypothetical protein [Sphingopyxis sp.]
MLEALAQGALRAGFGFQPQRIPDLAGSIALRQLVQGLLPKLARLFPAPLWSVNKTVIRQKEHTTVLAP